MSSPLPSSSFKIRTAAARTKYRQELDSVESKLFKVLSRVYKKIQMDMSLEIPNGQGHVTWTDIQYIYREKIDDIIRAAVTELYEIAGRKTVQKDIGIPFFLTQTDMAEIRRLAQRYQDTFWLGLEREVTTKGPKMVFDPDTLLLKTNPNNAKNELKDTFIGRTVDGIRGQVPNAAVISKARQVILGSRIRIKSASVAPITRDYRIAAVTKQKQLQRLQVRRDVQQLTPPPQAARQEPEPQAELLWVAAGDDRVCPRCGALEGETFDVEDTNIPEPIEDTHPWCRCDIWLVNAAVEEQEKEPFTSEFEDLERLLTF